MVRGVREGSGWKRRRREAGTAVAKDLCLAWGRSKIIKGVQKGGVRLRLGKDLQDLNLRISSSMS